MPHLQAASGSGRLQSLQLPTAMEQAARLPRERIDGSLVSMGAGARDMDKVHVLSDGLS